MRHTRHLGQATDGRPVRVFVEVLGDGQLTEPGRRAARADAGADRGAFDGIEVRLRKRGSDPGVQGVGLRVALKHGRHQGRVVPLDGLTSSGEYLVQRDSAPDHVVHLVVRGHQLLDPGHLDLGQSRLDPRGHDVRTLGQASQVVRRPLVPFRVSHPEPAHYLAIDDNLMLGHQAPNAVGDLSQLPQHGLEGLILTQAGPPQHAALSQANGVSRGLLRADIRDQLLVTVKQAQRSQCSTGVATDRRDPPIQVGIPC